MHGSLTGVLLAAGRGRRFGANKLIAQLSAGADAGQAVGIVSATRLAAVVDRLLVVVGGADGASDKLFRAAGFTTTCATESDQGMAHSLAHGVRASADSGGWLVALADMPFIAPATLTAVAAALRTGATIVVPRHDGRYGHPVGFAARYYAELVALKGDRGARELLERFADAVTCLDSDDGGVLRDVDTPDDLGGA